MGIGTSIVIMAIGALLTFAVEVDAEGFNINTAGVILMVLGLAGLIASMILWGPRTRRRTVDRDPEGRTTVYTDEV